MHPESQEKIGQILGSPAPSSGEGPTEPVSTFTAEQIINPKGPGEAATDATPGVAPHQAPGELTDK